MTPQNKSGIKKDVASPLATSFSGLPNRLSAINLRKTSRPAISRLWPPKARLPTVRASSNGI